MINIYQQRFDAIEDGQVIFSKNHKHQYIFHKSDGWRQAWSDTKTLAHAQLPQYWFVNPVGDVISVSYNARPVYVVPDTDNIGRYPKYHYVLPNGSKKAIAVHNLAGLVWDAPMSAEAHYLFNTKGLRAFGTGNADANGHHINDDITDSHFTNIEFLTKRPHAYMHDKKYEQLAEEISIPTVINTPYAYNAEGNYLRHSSNNSLQEVTLNQLVELLKNVMVSEILVEIGEDKYIVTFDITDEKPVIRINILDNKEESYYE